MNVLVLNAGSSSQKSSLYSFPDDALSHKPPNEPLAPLWEGFIDFGSLGKATFKVETASGQSLKDVLLSDNRDAAVRHLLGSGIAAMTASLGGLDALIFTAGVGEHATIVRAEVCEGLSFLGLGVSEEKNMREAGDSPLETLCDRNISSDQAVVPTLVIHTQEDWQIAKAYWQLQRA